MKKLLAIIAFCVMLPTIAEAGGFNGSGTYNRYYNWTNDKANGINITASRFDTEDSGFATGLSTTITKDGQQTTTARIPFAVGLDVNQGSVTVPSFSIIGDTTTGFYQTTTGEIRFGSVGVYAATLNANGLDNTPVGLGTASTGAFTTLSSSGLSTLNSASVTTTLASTGNFSVNSTKFTVTASSGAITSLAGATLGANSGTGGSIVLNGSTSGSATIKVAAAAGTSTNFQLPATNGTNTYLLQTDGSGNTSWAAPAVQTIVMASISGNIPTAISGTSTTAAVTISSGQASDSTNAVYLTGAGYSWAVSNGNAANGYHGGTTLPNSATIHFFLCSGGSGTTSFANNSTTPACPTGYATYSRRIFSLNTDGSGNLLGGTAIEAEGGSIIYYLTTQILDASTTTLTTSRTLFTLTVPSGIKVQPLYRAVVAAGTGVIITSPDETDVAPQAIVTGNTVPLSDMGNTGGYVSTAMGGQIMTTNTSSQIGARAVGASTSLYITTRGFKDFRRN